jgi:hypothetical protein
LLQRVTPTGVTGAQKSAACAESYCDSLIAAFDKKANHNKREALFFFTAIVVCTSTVPLFIALADGFLLGKIVPAALSSFAACSTAWLQLRRPQYLWGMYRTAHRELQDHRVRYDHRLAPYNDDEERQKILAEHSADIAIGAHYDWLPMIPNLNQLNTSAHSNVASTSKRHAK